MWKDYGPFRPDIGVLITGEPGIPETKWWNCWFLKYHYWKWVVFKIPDKISAVGGYRVGFIPGDGKPKLNSTVLRQDSFQVRIGREDCTFFALDRTGQEVNIVQATGPLLSKQFNIPAL